MNSVFEKIIEKLEEEKMSYFLTIANTGDEKLDCTYEQVGNALDKAIEIVKQEAEKFGRDTNVGSNGWIPVRYHYITDEEREEGCISEDIVYWLDCKLPEDEEEILITRKWRDGYIVEQDMCMVDDGYCLDSGLDWIDVIAWQPLPLPFRDKE